MNAISLEIHQYMEYCKTQKKLSANTLRAYHTDMEQFLRFIATDHNDLKGIIDISKDILREYVECLSEKYAVRSCNRKIACLKAFFNHMEFEDYIPANPFRKIKVKLREPKTLPKTMQKQEIKQQFEYVYQQITKVHSLYQQYRTHQNAACYELLFSTGIRVGELCSLEKKSIDFGTGTIRFFGKGSKERVAYITSEYALSTLKAYCLLRDKRNTQSGCFFVGWNGSRLSESSVRQTVKRISSATISRHVTPHMFRHTFATMLLERNIDIRFIQELLSHSSIKTTQIYLHLFNSAIRAVLAGNNPRDSLAISSI